MDMSILEQIGLTKTEIKIYLALLRLGQSTTTGIVKESGVHASKVYEFLERLVKKGLVSYTIKSNKKHFIAADPSALRIFLQEKRNDLSEKEKEVDMIIPRLDAIKKKGNENIWSQTYEGLRGVKSVYRKMLDILERGETQYIIGAPRMANEQIEGFLLDWHKKRVKKGIRCRYIYDADARKYGRVRKMMSLTDVRYMPNNIVSPLWVEVFGDHVLIGHIKKYNAVVFLIHDKEIARGYLDHFNLLWKLAER